MAARMVRKNAKTQGYDKKVSGGEGELNNSYVLFFTFSSLSFSFDLFSEGHYLSLSRSYKKDMHTTQSIRKNFPFNNIVVNSTKFYMIFFFQCICIIYISAHIRNVLFTLFFPKYN